MMWREYTFTIFRCREAWRSDVCSQSLSFLVLLFKGLDHLSDMSELLSDVLRSHFDYVNAVFIPFLCFLLGFDDLDS